MHAYGVRGTRSDTVADGFRSLAGLTNVVPGYCESMSGMHQKLTLKPRVIGEVFDDLRGQPRLKAERNGGSLSAPEADRQRISTDSH